MGRWGDGGMGKWGDGIFCMNSAFSAVQKLAMELCILHALTLLGTLH
uniref:Uncharacterized protein n=1 Tax=Desertifilum tharense IPPAS B-1220 TaxID=1781255 RepID=A0ACD5GR53_9CYAN